MHALRLTGLTAAGLGLVGLGAVVAGPLNPPAGPVSFTYKTLAEIEPRVPIQSLTGDATAQYVITQPGSYYLTGNITGVQGRQGISVRANDVTIDLCGHTMSGFNPYSSGVFLDTGFKGMTVRNGTMSNWGVGVHAGDGIGCRLESLEVRGSWLYPGQASLTRNCTAIACGIFAGSDALVVDCVAKESVSVGIQVGDGSAVHRCSVGPTSSVFYGSLQCGNGCTLTECTVSDSSKWGILAGSDCSILRCSVSNNAGGGIWVQSGGLIRGCHLELNTHGILAEGIYPDTGQGTVIEECVVVSPLGATYPTSVSISVQSNCTVLRNRYLGPTAMMTSGSGNRIDSNFIEGGSIWLNDVNNLLVRNRGANLSSSYMGSGNGHAAVMMGNPWGNWY